MFVKSIDTFPALALSEVVLYFSCPSEFAARLSVCPAPSLLAGAGVEEAAELDVVGVSAALAGVDAEELVLFDEPPQPARASRPTASVSAESLGTELRPVAALRLTGVFRRVAALSLTVDPPLFGAIGR